MLQHHNPDLIPHEVRTGFGFFITYRILFAPSAPSPMVKRPVRQGYYSFLSTNRFCYVWQFTSAPFISCDYTRTTSAFI